MDCYLWRHGADRVTDSSDPLKVGTLSWMPLARMPELAAQSQLLGAGLCDSNLVLHSPPAYDDRIRLDVVEILATGVDTRQVERP